MIRTLVVAGAFSMLASVAIAGEQKAGAVAVAEAEATVELISLDRSTRVAVVRGENGGTLTINLPAQAQNLDRVKVGDRFRMRYVEALALALNKGGSAGATQGRTVELAPKGGTPGGKVVDTKQVTAVVAAVDRASRIIVVEGPQKNVMSLRVADEVRSFDQIAVGDTIAVTYTEALMLEMIVD